MQIIKLIMAGTASNTHYQSYSLPLTYLEFICKKNSEKYLMCLDQGLQPL